MEDLAEDRFFNNWLVLSDVKKDSRPAGDSERALITDPPFIGRPPLLVDTRSQKDLVVVEPNPADLSGTPSNTEKSFTQCQFVVSGVGCEREIQVFGESVGLKVALLNTGPSLKHPSVSCLGITGNCGENPAENVVLLDNLSSKLPFSSPFKNVLLVNHEEISTGKVDIGPHAPATVNAPSVANCWVQLHETF